MLKPKPRVVVGRWSPTMKLTRPWQVEVQDGNDRYRLKLGDGQVLARFANEDDARLYAAHIQRALVTEK